MTTYDRGDLVGVQATFKTADGTLVDPTAVTFMVRNPDDRVTTFVYGTDSDLTRISAGFYQCVLDINKAGTWHYRWASTGTGQAAEEGSFIVRVSDVLP